MIPTPHDALFKRTFGDPIHAAGELRAILPPALVARLDFDALQVEPGSFIDEELSQRHADLLYSVPLGAERVMIYLLFEHQSTADPLMLFRLLRYMLRIWEQYLKAHSEVQRLPLLIPAVLYHGEERWSAPVGFEDLVELPADLRSELSPLVPHFRCVLDDLSQFTTEDLRDRSLTALGSLVLFLFKEARTAPDLIERLEGWVDALQKVWQAADGMSSLEAVTRYMMQVASKSARPERLKALLTRALGPKSQEVVMTVAEELIEQGIDIGIEQGIEQGIERAKAKQRRTLLRVLARRFGELPPEAVVQVEAADLDQLNAWFEGLFTAESLAHLLTQVPHPED